MFCNVVKIIKYNEELTKIMFNISYLVKVWFREKKEILTVILQGTLSTIEHNFTCFSSTEGQTHKEMERQQQLVYDWPPLSLF